MAKTSPTQRSLKLLKDTGWNAEVVERWIHAIMRKQDLFNCIDIVAIRFGELAGVQVTSGSNVSARIAKIKKEPMMVKWLEANGTLYVHGWREVVAYRKNGKKAKRKRWECRVVPITLDMLRAEVVVSGGAPDGL